MNCRTVIARIGVCAALFGCEMEPQSLKNGGLYAVEDGGGKFAIVKLLVVEKEGVHVRLYKNKFESRPTTVDPATLSLGSVKDPNGGGIGHLPITHGNFRAWQPSLIGDTVVTEEELEGYRMWRDGKGGYFGSK